MPLATGDFPRGRFRHAAADARRRFHANYPGVGAMSAAGRPPILGRPGAPDPAARPASAVGRLLMRVGDRLNPILVKETRQALKSRQFTITFGLLLIAVWVWTILGVALIGPPLWYGAEGRAMFFGYYLILALPLLVIVPFGALRRWPASTKSTPTTCSRSPRLGPRQIVGGKLGSSDPANDDLPVGHLALPRLHLHAPRHRRAHDRRHPLLDVAGFAGACGGRAAGRHAQHREALAGGAVGAGRAGPVLRVPLRVASLPAVPLVHGTCPLPNPRSGRSLRPC